MLKNRAIGHKKTFTITDPTLTYSIIDPATTLPNAKPVTAQVTHTMLSTDRPTFSFPPASAQYAVIALIWGKNNDTTAAHAVGWHADIDSTPIIADSTYSVTSDASGIYYTLQATFGAVENPDGKTYNFSVWDDDGTGNLDIRGYSIMQYPTKIQLESGKILYDVSWSDINTASAIPPFTGLGFNPGGSSDNYVRYDETTNTIDKIGKTTATTKKIVYSDPYAFTHGYIDVVNLNKVTGLSHASYYPNWRYPLYPHTLSYRSLNIEGKL